MESALGEAAERIWSHLAAHGAMSLRALQEGTRLPVRFINMGIGWLAREGKIRTVRQGRNLKLTIQEGRRKRAPIRIPGFYAEASLYRSSEKYVTVSPVGFLSSR